MKKILSVILSITILFSMTTMIFADEPTGVLAGEQNKEDNDKLIYGYQVDDTGKILNSSELKKFYIEFAMDNRIDFIPDFDEQDYKTNNPVSTEDFLMLTYYMNKYNLSEDLSMSAELVEKVMRENFGIEKVEHKSQFKGWTYVEEENKYTPYPEGTAEDVIFDVINFNSYKENDKKIYDVTLREYYLPFLFSKDDSASSDIYNSYVEYTKNEENVYRKNVLFLLAEKGEKIKNAEINIYNALYDLIVEDNTDGFTAGKTIRIKYYIDKTTGNPRFIYKNEEENTLEISGTPLAPPSDWATADVEKAKALNITTDDVIYRYRMSITREEFCNLAYNYIVEFGKDLEVSNSHKFNDTDNVKIEALSSLGIIKGKSETEFAPNDLLTREEAATILNRLINVVHPGLANTEEYFEFADGAKISDWAMSDIQRICNMGVMKGVGNNNFAPKDNYTTEQAIVTLVRVYANSAVSKNDVTEGILYKNEKMNVQFEIPVSWQGKYFVDESVEDYIVLKHTAIAEKYEGAGAICSVYKEPDETVDATLNMLGNQTVVWQNQDYAYIVGRPTDVQHPIWDDRDDEDSVLASEYEEMAEGIVHIISTFSLINEVDVPVITNAENMSYAQIRDLQRQANNGHFPWRMDYEQVVKSFLSGKGIDIESGKITELTGGADSVSLTYSVKGKEYIIELFKPIDTSEHGIWLVRTFEESENK